MTLEEFLSQDKPPDSENVELDQKELTRFFWKYKALLKERERNNSFWESTNENLKLAYESLREKELKLEEAYRIIQEDLQLASQVQNSLLPGLQSKMEKEIDIAVYNKQLTEVGGDYYDFFTTKNDDYGIGLFDISGHGVSAALIMSYLKAQFMQIIQVFNSPKNVVEHVNTNSLNFFKKAKRYATVNFVLFQEDKIRYVCGGGYGLLLHQNSPTYFKNLNSFIGLRNSHFLEYELPFISNDLLALYTDGVIESQDGKGSHYSARRLNDTIIQNAHKNVNEILTICMDDYHSTVQKDVDDITLIIIKKRGYDYGNKH